MHILVVGTSLKFCSVLLERGCVITYMDKISGLDTSLIEADFYQIIAVSEDTDDSKIESLVTTIDKSKKIDRVVCLHDRSQELAIVAAKSLGLRFFNEEAIAITKNKYLMRKKLVDAELTNVNFRYVESLSDLEQFKDVGFPCIAKPTSGSGSKGVFKINSENDVAAFRDLVVNEYSDCKFLVEEFIEGIEYSVEAFSENGIHRILAITDKYKDEVTFIENGHLIPAQLDECRRLEMIKYVSNVLSALNISDGVSHTEIILTKNGPEIVETHTRCGGDHITKLVAYVTGVDMVELAVSRSLGESVIDSVPKDIINHGCAAIWYYFPKNIGVVSEDVDFCKIRTLPNIVNTNGHLKAGTMLSEVKNSFDRPAYAIATHKEPDVTLSSARRAMESLKVKIKLPL